MQALHLVGSISSGQSVLTHAGASGVGQAAIQVAKSAGASVVFSTAGTDDKCQLCISLGADFAVNYRRQDFTDIVARETKGCGVDLIIDLVGRDYWQRNIASAAMDAKIVVVALMSGGVIEDFNLRELMNKRIWVLPTTLRTRKKEYQKVLRNKFVELALPRLVQDEMKITIDKVFPWTNISEAHKRLESNIGAGKVICQVTI